MNLRKYWLLILIPPLLIGGVAYLIYRTSTQQDAQTFFINALIVNILIYIPIIGLLRMRYLKFTWKDFLLSFIPFYGIHYRTKRLFYSKKEK